MAICRRLLDAVHSDEISNATPIGFYFAKLWYYERLYPLIFSVSALGQALRRRRAALGEAPGAELRAGPEPGAGRAAATQPGALALV